METTETKEITNTVIASGVNNYSKAFTFKERLRIFLGAHVYHLIDRKTGQQSWGVDPSFDKLKAFRRQIDDHIRDCEPDENGFTKEQRDYITAYACKRENQDTEIVYMTQHILDKWPNLNPGRIKDRMYSAIINGATND